MLRGQRLAFPWAATIVSSLAMLLAVAGCPGATTTDICSGVVCAPGRLCKQGLCVYPPGVDGPSPPGDGAPNTEAGGTEAGGTEAGGTEAGGPQPDLAKPQPDSAGIKCSDKACNGQETCKSCPEDCGACECEPPQDQTVTTGCLACESKRRDCLPTFHWGPWEACRTTCNAGYVCNASRCVIFYDAMPGVVGPYCGYIPGAGTYTHVFCQAHDFCLDATNRKCRGYQALQAGDIYHAYVHSGSTCGMEPRFLDADHEVFCDQYDPCVNMTARQCRR